MTSKAAPEADLTFAMIELTDADLDMITGGAISVPSGNVLCQAAVPYEVGALAFGGRNPVFWTFCE